MNNAEQITKQLTDFISASPTSFHVIANIKRILDQNGFEALREDRTWTLTPGRGYYVTRNDSSMIAFKIPSDTPDNIQLISAHSDSPCFKIKENEEIARAGHYIELNVERYGGMLCAPWFDRPLSIAGRVLIEEDGVIRSQLIDFDRDLVMIPSLAIHMNRQANDSASYKIQSDMLPLFGDESSAGVFCTQIAELAGVAPEQIISRDLFLYPRTPASFWGCNNEYFSTPRLDDLQCAFTALQSFLVGGNDQSITMCCIFDNEEVGSSTKQGADSTFLSDTLDRICDSLSLNRAKQLMMISSGFMLSTDNGHAVHPNHIEKADPTNQPYMNGGVLIKYNAAQKYATDGVSSAIFRSICKKAGVPTQVYVNHSDVAGGSTLGNISNSHVSLNTIDIGCAQLAMHSPYETGGIQDTLYLFQAMKAFYSTHIHRNDDGNYILD